MITFYLTLGFVVANAPWLSEKMFFLVSVESKKHHQRLLEWLTFMIVFMFFGIGLERQQVGQNHPQAWEFYVVLALIFAVFSAPGFIYRINFLSASKKAPSVKKVN